MNSSECIQKLFPRYRGVNLDSMFCTEQSKFAKGNRRGYFIERDFAEVADFGFDFVRLPLSYRLFTTPEKPLEFDDRRLELLDQAIAWGDKYKQHVNICLHRVPGYCVNLDEPADPSWTESLDMQNAFINMWRHLAKRYQGYSYEKLSFDLVNEPSPNDYSLAFYTDLMKRTITAIREIDAQRFCMIDGWDWGDTFIEELAGIPYTGQSLRGYNPREVTHYTIHSSRMPSWPMLGADGKMWNFERLEKYIRAWTEFSIRTNTPIHCGEFGCFNKTPDDVMLKWLGDFLWLLKKYNIGWGLWTVHGPFGIFRDTDNPEKLNLEILKLLQKY